LACCIDGFTLVRMECMTTPKENFHLVDGAVLPRPFQVRRLGHFGINVASVSTSLDFYGRLLGFEISDPLDFGPRIPQALKDQVGPTLGYFMRHGTDHHSFVVFPQAAMLASNPHYAAHPHLNVNQLTWQVASLREVANGLSWFESQGSRVLRSGRDTPGSNWHIYPVDPAGHINELYYGIEQIGWTGHSKPMAMHGIRYTQPPELPHRSEYAEVNQAVAQGMDLGSGHRRHDSWAESFDVGGILLARPFKITKVGPVRLFVDDCADVLRFYTHTLGLTLTEQAEVSGHTCYFLRANTEHHSLALYPEALRHELGFQHQRSLLGFGLQLGSYGQLRAAVQFMLDAGHQALNLPQALSPGLGHHVWLQDPDGNAVQLYWEMEQIGWDGRPRPWAQRRVWPQNPSEWPEHIPTQSDSFMGEVFLGPLN
jgi:catechol 2,3-dioxygenase-like lactoylglutathione lyase family enzyme